MCIRDRIVSNNVATAQANTLTIKSPKLELGSVKTSEYVTRLMNTITIPLTQPLRSVNSVCDRIIKKDGLWGVERHFGSKTLNGSEVWSSWATNTTDVYRYAISSLNGVIKKPATFSDVANIKSTRYVAIPTGSTYAKTVGIGVEVNGNLFIYDSTYNTSDVSLFKTWLASNNVTVIYELATPVFEPFSQSIQDQLNKLQSYQGVTNVFTTDPQQPVMIVQYGKTDSSALALYAENVSDSKIDKSKSVNNLITTVEGTVLDGRQGKALSEKIGNLSDLKTTSKTDLVGAVNEVNNNLGYTEMYSGKKDVANATSIYPSATNFTRTVLDAGTDRTVTYIRDTDGRIIFNTAGYYLVTITAVFTINGTGIRRIVANNVQYGACAGTLANEAVLTVTLPIYIPSSGHTIPFNLFQNSGGSLSTDIQIYITKMK